MYQTIIRDPGGDSLIRIHPDICGTNTTVVNGSILIVPPGTTAFVVINGQLSRPYGLGRYEIFSGVDPFFVRLRHLMTRGDAGVSVAVFFVSTDKCKFMTLGTGEIPFRDQRFNITMKALASCNLTFSIGNPQKVLSKLVGTYASAFSEDDIEPCIEQLTLMPIREAISRELSKLNVVEFNSKLSHIGNSVLGVIRSGFSDVGITLSKFNLVAINVPETEMKRLNELEQEYAAGKTRTDLELDHLTRVWNGNIDNRTMSKMMTGMASRGYGANSATPTSPAGAGNGMAPMMLQMMMMSQLLPTLREPMANMTGHTDLFRGNFQNPNESTSTADAPPPMPARYRRCPACNGNVLRNARSCPVCGHSFM